MPRPSGRYAAPLAALLLTLSACSDPTGTGAGPTPATSPAGTSASTAAPSPSTTHVAPTGGTAEDPVTLSPTTALLDWAPVAGTVDTAATRGGGWTLGVTQSGRRATIEGPSSGSGIATARDERISEALLDGRYAVIVVQDEQESEPATAQVHDLQHPGRDFTIDGSSEVPTTTGGTWALGGGHLLHATIGRDGAYCLASVDLATRRSTQEWCAPARHGFNDARVTPAGDSLLTFDDAHPSCRTVVSVADGAVEPFPGVPDCQGWDGLLTEDGAVWSVVADESRIESARFLARTGEEYFDLGPGTSGSLTWCGGAAYFVRDPQRDRDPARLMRWSASEGLAVVYESPAGPAFLTEPRCGGDTLTITALAQGGDEQVSAPLG